MGNKNQKVYIDTEQSFLQHQAFAFCGSDDEGNQQEVIYTGKKILTLPVTDRKEKSYQILADECDVHFIFDDAIPQLNFYPVQQLLVFATDSFGGCFASNNTAMDISAEDAPIYYIDKNLKYYYLSSKLIRFMEMVVFCPFWKKEKHIHCEEVFYPSQSGKEYLVGTLKLKKCNATIKAVNENIDDFIIYASKIEAQKNIGFYDIKDIITKFKN